MFQSSFSNQICRVYWTLANFKRMALHSNERTAGIVGSRSVPQHESSFWHIHTSQSFPYLHPPTPHPPRKPNMNENSNHNMLGPLRSPLPAAKWNRSSSTV